MRNKIVLYVILIFIFVTTQVTFLNFISVFGVKPNLAIILIVCISLLEGRTHGAIVGFFTGLCLDAIVGIALGFNALLGMLLGLLLGNINKRFFKENILVMAICTFLSTLLYESAVVFTNYFFNQEANYYSILTEIILPEALFNSILGCAIFILIILVGKRFINMDEKNRY